MPFIAIVRNIDIYIYRKKYGVMYYLLKCKLSFKSFLFPW